MKINPIGFYTVGKDQIIIFDSKGQQHVLSSKKYDLNEISLNIADFINENLELNLDDYKINTHKLVHYCVPLEDIDKITKHNITSYPTIDSVEYDTNNIMVTIYEEQVIPYSNKLEKYLQPDQPTEGLTNFLSKFKDIRKKCNHTAQQLAEFLHKANLPLTKSGAIIGYKKVRKAEFSPTYIQQTYVDIYSGNITQMLNTIVKTKRKYVNDDRTIDCSHGLHVASLKYLTNGFFGSSNPNDAAIFVVKVEPKDVISVPQYDVTKLRCCKYEIVGVFTDEAFKMLHDGVEPSEIDSNKALLNDVLNNRTSIPLWVITVGNNKNVESIKPINDTQVNKHFTQTNYQATALQNPEEITKEISDYNAFLQRFK